MQPHSLEQLVASRCRPCAAGATPYTPQDARRQLQVLDGWQLTAHDRRISKSWTVKHFMAGLEFFQRVAELAEADAHHPDLHLEGYRALTIELTTHAIGGLSENDFILAAKIDRLEIALR